MSGFRDMSVPYTAEEVQEILEACRKFESYDGFSFAAEEFTSCCLAMRYERTPEQIQAYEDYFKNYLGGRLPLEGEGGLESILHVMHSASLYAGWFVSLVDTDKDGIISADEFKKIFDVMSKEWPVVAGKTYEDFLRESDTDNSGAVCTKEFVDWLAAIESAQNPRLQA